MEAGCEEAVAAVVEVDIDAVAVTNRTGLVEALRIGVTALKVAYCTDNAAMIAALGYHQLKAGEIAGLDVDAYASAT